MNFSFKVCIFLLFSSVAQHCIILEKQKGVSDIITPKKRLAMLRHNERNKQKYDRLNILIPKGTKTIVEAEAKAANESINAYTNKALLQRMNLKSWPINKPESIDTEQ